MKVYDPKEGATVCAKCGHWYHEVEYMQRAIVGVGWVGEMEIVCNRCHYRWTELPMDTK